MLSFCGEQMINSFLIYPEHLWGILDRTNLECIQLLSDEFTQKFCKIYIQYISIIFSAFMGQLSHPFPHLGLSSDLRSFSADILLSYYIALVS